MKVDPQTLIDMPYAGMAEKELRKAGMWRVTTTDTERLDWIAENTVSAECQFDTWKFKTGNTDIDAEFLREDIDSASSLKETETTT